MVTIRLADSLSPERLAQLRGQFPPEAKASYANAVESELDRGYGKCWLRQPTIAQLVEDALLFFDGQRYRQLCWVVMPNHVHTLIEVLPGWPLGKVIWSWKSFTSKEANKILGRTGEFWMPDYFDRFIRDQDHLLNAIRYIHYNPVKAGLCLSQTDWPWSSQRLYEF